MEDPHLEEVEGEEVVVVVEVEKKEELLVTIEGSLLKNNTGCWPRYLCK